jgi:tetratricopeptide (TPR) repeat protein
MAKKLFHRIFRKPEAEPIEPARESAEPIRIADQQPDPLPEPAEVAGAAPLAGSEAESAPERDLPSYLSSAADLRDSGRFEEAEELLVEAAERFPDDPRPYVNWALLAHHRGDWPETISRWAQVRARYPDQTIAIWHGAAALSRQQKYDDAEALLAEGRERFPNDLGIAMESAWVATHRRDWAEALRRWQSVRDQFPDSPRGYTGTAMAHRELGHFDEGETILAEAVERFPQDLAACIDYARLAEARRDRPEALRRWQAVRDAFPGQTAGYTGAAALLRDERRFEEAETLLAEAAKRFPADARLDIERATLAHHRRDWAEAAPRWEGVRARLPEQRSGYLHGVAVLRELKRFADAEAVLSAGLERFPSEAGLHAEFALLAEARGEWTQAAESWAALRIAFPHDVRGFTLGARALRQLGRTDEAEDLLADAIHRFPRDLGVLSEYAWAAFNQNRWSEAEIRFAEVLAQFPDAPVGYIGSAVVHRVQGRFDEAEALLQTGIARLPRNPEIIREYARLPLMPEYHSQKDWDEALRRLEVLRSSFPGYEPGWQDSIRYASEGERFDVAEEVAGAAVERFPNSPELSAQWATVALDRRDYKEAVTRFAAVIERFDHHEAAYVGIADALTAAGRHTESDKVLREAQARFPHSTKIACAYARVATLRLDWKEAFERLNQAQRRFPHDREVSRQLFAARLRLTETEDVGEADIADLQPRTVTGPDEDNRALPSGIAALAPQKLLQCFESLGGTLKGCEFGLVQREFEVEPLGLLRWTDITPENLIAAMEARFDGVGLPENTELTAMSAGGPLEWSSSDRRFGMQMHTFAPAASVPREQMFRQVCRRLQFLRDKLISDLEAGSKIFVYKITARNLTDEELAALHGAMRRYGDNALLYVRYAEPDREPGTVQTIRQGLMIGYIDRFWMDRDGNSLGPVTQSWLTICQNAYALWQAQRDAQITPAVAKDEDVGASGGGLEFPARELVMKFESLGGSGHGCEFGIFQREFGVEPLGLLRWADLGHEALAEALETGFEGVGLPEQTELFVPPSTGRHEYWTRDKRYWMAMRTFVPADEIAEDKMFERVCRRLQFLKRKMIEDLAGPSKVFVYKVIARNLRQEEVGRIHRAMRAYGDNTLLYVGYADRDHPAGTVELARPGLILGYVERFAFAPDDTNLGPATEGWLAVCRAAYDLWQSEAAIPAEVSSKQLEPLTA